MKTTPDGNKLLWLSFCDATKPKGEQFLGVVIIGATDVVEASRKAWNLGINPGGEIKSVELPPDCYVPEKAQNKLLSKQGLRMYKLI